MAIKSCDSYALLEAIQYAYWYAWYRILTVVEILCARVDMDAINLSKGRGVCEMGEG
ncbi:predicted protein [Plenodomus lingam JN3]|uniref:Predicted protein n=1 Tax=Leptosphaeria maculans (strain JN3 / isolate v23.1.3 / race Av1-4-5-6-7-8) TaxID=985895 RepID=E5A2P8_LEPMJ|nr:predicted protein [Plenodomus lingam JN3]CBX97844.1 predicted protein [Plenodomus lingam JN3]